MNVLVFKLKKSSNSSFSSRSLLMQSKYLHHQFASQAVRNAQEKGYNIKTKRKKKVERIKAADPF